MANGKLLRQLIRSGAEGDLGAFRGAARRVIDEERQKQHHLLANDLEIILDGRASTPASAALRRLAETIPQDRDERGLPLLAVHGPARHLEDVVLAPQNRSLVAEVLREYNREVLNARPSAQRPAAVASRPASSRDRRQPPPGVRMPWGKDVMAPPSTASCSAWSAPSWTSSTSKPHADASAHGSRSALMTGK